MPSTASPTSLITTGFGIPWQNTPFAVTTGVGSQNGTILTGFSIVSNVITVTTITQVTPFVAGQQITVSNMVQNTFLNGAVLTVLSTGLSATQFEANYTFSGTMTATDAGALTPNTTFAFAQNVDQAFTPPPGQSVAFAMVDEWTGSGVATGDQLFCPCAYGCFQQICGGTGGDSFTPHLSSQSAHIAIPTLPPGAVITGIYGIAFANKNSINGSFIGLQAVYSGVGSPSDFLMNSTWESTGNLGTSLSIISAAYFVLTIFASLACIGSYGGNVVSAGFAITYTASSTPPPTQLQTLQGTDCGFSIPGTEVITGVEVNFQSGIASGTSCTLEFQLTLNGTPIGSIKSLSVSSWTTSSSLGGSTDLWGTGGLTPSQVNGSTGIGINVFGTLADATQVNLNELSITIFGNITVYSHIPVTWISVGNTRTPSV
jgi:hypothetical protein